MPISTYDVRVSGTSSVGSSDPRPKALIRLREGGTTVGFIRFFDTGVPIPTDVERPSGDGVITEMNLPVSLLPSVVDLLRNEQPIFFFFGDRRAHVTSVPEGVGEGEE